MDEPTNAELSRRLDEFGRRIDMQFLELSESLRQIRADIGGLQRDSHGQDVLVKSMLSSIEKAQRAIEDEERERINGDKAEERQRIEGDREIRETGVQTRRFAWGTALTIFTIAIGAVSAATGLFGA